MNAKNRTKLIAVIAGGFFLTLLAVGIVYAASVNIDTFNAGVQNLTVNSSTTVLSDTASAAGDVVDTYRDVWVSYSSGSNAINLTVDTGGGAGSNELSYSAGAGTDGSASVTWDGDQDPGSLSPTGLGNEDFIDSSPANDGIFMVVTLADHEATLTFTGYEDGSNYEDLAITFNHSDADIGRLDLFYPFTDFTVQSGTGADWSSLGALVLDIEGDPDLDLTIDYLEARDGDDIREYGDLPSGYGSLLDAYHIPNGLTLGIDLDSESSSNASSDAAGDDGSDYDDEDGVTPTNLAFWVSFSTGFANVTVNGCTGTCYVNGWIDWNDDGDFDDTVNGASEQIEDDEPLGNGASQGISFPSPGSAMSQGYYYARFRVCDTINECDSPGTTGVDSGEVEDYRWALGPTSVSLSAFDAAWNGDQVAVTWETALEQNTVGFNVWRGTEIDGSYTQVNDTLIPCVSPGGVSGGSYAFTDADVIPGTTYYYQLEELETSGTSNWYGPASIDGSSPTAVTTVSTTTARVWWPAAAAGIIVSVGLATFLGAWRKRHRHT
jgi:hypothetical protein